MVICCISDTHEFHGELTLPKGDLLIHAGDFTHLPRLSALREFDDWLGELPFQHIVVVPGNHDGILEERNNRRTIKNATLLVNSGVSFEGIRIWGSPVTPLPNVAFGMPNAADRKKLWARIPRNVDILVTHCPPYGVGDQETGSDVHQGCPELRDAILRVRPRFHVFGHIHGGHGISQNEHTTFVNAALYENGKPIVFSISAERRSR